MTVVQEMVLQDRKLRCLVHEFLLSILTTYWFWSRDQRDHCHWAGNEQSPAFLCLLLVRYVRDPEWAQKEDLFAANGVAFPAVWSFSDTFSMCWLLDTF